MEKIRKRGERGKKERVKREERENEHFLTEVGTGRNISYLKSEPEGTFLNLSLNRKEHF